MAIEFDRDVAIITGAGRGLGRAHALLLSELGARVVVNDIGGAADGTGADEGAAAQVVREIAARGGTAVADTNDGSTIEGAQAIIATALDTFGKLDAVVANAGILRDQSFHNVSDEDWFAVVNVHLVGTMRVLHAAYPHMREQGYGRIVTTTSAAGLWGNFGQTSYAAAKLGIVGLTRALAHEGVKRNIRANVIAPGAATRMTEALIPDGLGEKMRPEYVSPLVAYFCHPSCEATGQIISVGAGRFARVTIAVAPGQSTDEPTADWVAENFEAIAGEEELIHPGHAMEEIALLMQAER
ncbi:MAG: SDR family NAD(P)-dependent oxidoreductase [Solirubrobacteraceae bacterium]